MSTTRCANCHSIISPNQNGGWFNPAIVGFGGNVTQCFSKGGALVNHAPTPEGEVADEVVRELPKTLLRPGQFGTGDVLIGTTNRIVQETQFVKGGVRVHLVNGETFVLNGRFQHAVVRAAEVAK